MSRRLAMAVALLTAAWLLAYGPTVERTIGYAYLSAALSEGASVEIDVFDRLVAAVITPDVVVDPPGDRMRG